MLMMLMVLYSSIQNTAIFQMYQITTSSQNLLLDHKNYLLDHNLLHYKNYLLDHNLLHYKNYLLAHDLLHYKNYLLGHDLLHYKNYLLDHDLLHYKNYLLEITKSTYSRTKFITTMFPYWMATSLVRRAPLPAKLCNLTLSMKVYISSLV